MDSTDADMMDSESPPPPPPPSPPPSNSNQVDGVRGLLAFARHLIDQGKPSQALQAALGLGFPDVQVWFHYVEERSNTFKPGFTKCAKLLEKVLRKIQVVMAMRAEGGEEAVFQALNRARESYRNKIRASSAADELASLFAECAIAEALPSSTPELMTQSTMMQESFEPDGNGTSILAETGRKQIMMDAFSDGSSFVCLQCGGLVSNHRRDEHYAFWCGHS